MADGRVLADDYLPTPEWVDTVRFIDTEYAKTMIRNLVATVLGRDKTIVGWKHANENLHQMGHHYLDTIDGLKQQNKLMREALQSIQDRIFQGVDGDVITDMIKIASDTLAKLDESN